mgnify:CR=1 FL=1
MVPEHGYYEFKPRHVPLLTKDTVLEILHYIEKERDQVEVSVDLGLSKEYIRICKDYIVLKGTPIEVNTLVELSNICRDDEIYALDRERIIRLAFFKERHFYKLKYLGRGIAPTVEIDGMHMHRITGITPWEDAKLKVDLVKVRRCNRVLDICTGLGYTAIAALRRGACSILSIEVDENILLLAEYNPWSRELDNKKVKILLGDAYKVISELDSLYFDKIVHDPPRPTLAPLLYSYDFYTELYRVLKPKGTLFHYTGRPGKSRGIDLARGVMRRLQRAGFKVRRCPQAEGVLAYK